MPTVHRHVYVEQSASRMFDLVNSVSAYQKWFRWCAASQVISATDQHIVARLDIRLGAFKTWFTTTNSLERPTRIGLTLCDGPFRQLEGEWRFDPVAENRCKVSLSLEFEPTTRLLAPVVSLGLQGLVDRMVHDFIEVAQRET